MATSASKLYLALCVGIVIAGFFLLRTKGSRDPVPPEPARFVGSARCVQCHEEEGASWRGSQHARAIEAVDDEQLAAAFDGKTRHFGALSVRFVAEGEERWVETEEVGGVRGRHRVKALFGVHPLRQLLLEQEGGRLAAFGIAWDSRKAEEGGQRWYSLHPEGEPPPGDLLHWAGPYQNWNTMCAECHGTQVRKGYDAATCSYHTSWEEFSVGCEACHGAGSRHVTWAEGLAPDAEPTCGEELLVDLRGSTDATWTFDETSGNARRNTALPTPTQVETCARCHSRRSTIDESGVTAERFLDTHRPAFIEPGLYHADGQIKDEVYVYGSFLQSRMHRMGVVCSDCHDVHRAGLKSEGDALCFRCHRPEKFETPEHHHHPAHSPGARCVNCHMPATTYMGIDARRDHSLRVPRPDLGVRFGTPDACSGCHADQEAGWAAKKAKAWWPKLEERSHFVEVFAPAWKGQACDDAALAKIVEDRDEAGIVRGSALRLLDVQGGSAVSRAVREGSRDPDPLLRLAAVEWAEAWGPESRLDLLGPMLKDRVRAVRIAAARLLTPLLAKDPKYLADHREAFDAALGEYEAEQKLHLDRPESHLNLGMLAWDRGDFAEAERAFRSAMELPHAPAGAWLNLADLQRSRSEEERCRETLEEGLRQHPRAAALHHALGLALVRETERERALKELEVASDLAPEVVRYGLVHAIALWSMERKADAVSVLEGIVTRRLRSDSEAYVQLILWNQELGRLEEAKRLLAAFEARHPGAFQLKWLKKRLGR